MPSATRSCRCRARRRGTALAGVHRRPELVEHALADDQVLEARGEPIAIDVRPRGHAGAHVGVVLRERHRRRADVARDVEELHRAVAAEVGQRVAVAGGAGAAGAAHLDQLLDARVLDERVEHRVRQAQLVGERRAGRFAGDQRLQQQLRERVGMQPGLRDRRRRRRRRRLAATRRPCDRRERRRSSRSSLPSVASSMRWPICGAGRVQRARRQLEHPGRAAARQADPPGLQVAHAVDDHAALVERDDVDGEPHPQVCTPRLGTIHSAFAGLQTAAVQQPDGRVARVSATATLSATTAPVSRFLAMSAMTSLVVRIAISASRSAGPGRSRT